MRRRQTAEEARDWFRRMRLCAYAWDGACAEAFSKAFNKKRADDCKRWLQAYDAGRVIDYAADGLAGGAGIPYGDFIDRDLIHFSNYDVLRSIPSVMDGLKVSQRKALFGCRKRNLVAGEMRVAQLAAYVSEHSCFHHSEASMQGTIVCLAQDFVGSGNNLPLLVPIGQFGTRLNGGSDYASPRYIHTQLAPVAARLFVRDDDAVLRYLDDDGIAIEPAHYLPVVPLVLINGAQGIGTGYSTMVPSYDPAVVIGAVRAWVERSQRGEGEGEGDAPPRAEWRPWYRGFTGAIERAADGGKPRSRGAVALASATKARVTELPLGVWTEDFKEALEALVAAEPDVKSYANESSEARVDFTVTFASAAAARDWMAPAAGAGSGDAGLTRLEARLKMTSAKGLATTNMHLFDAAGRIRKYESPDDIVEEFCAVRLAGYEDRRRHLIAACADEVKLLANRARFVALVGSGELQLGGRDDAELDADLQARGFDRIDGADDGADDGAGGGGARAAGYAYLLGMRLSSLTQRRRAQLEAQLAEREARLRTLEGSTPHELWLADLASLEESLAA